MKILVTGGNSGLGKYITSTIPGCLNLTRNNRQSLITKLKEEGVDLIIHCAFGTQGGYKQNDIIDYFKYVDDNILLNACSLKIVYISSLVVYESEVINYKYTKLYAESIIKNLGTNPLILRCPAMLGKHMRSNNVLRLINDPNTQLSLTKESNFNYILHSDILDFILHCYENNINDILPFVSSNNITLEEIVDILGVDAHYGNYTFNTMLLSNEHLIKYNSILNKTSQEVFKQFLNQL